MHQIWITPKPGVKVRHPQTGQHVPDTGLLVTPDSYWERRLADGDVVVSEPPAAESNRPKKSQE